MKKRIKFLDNRKSGVTMMELVVAIAVFTIMVSMALPSLSNIVRNNQHSKDIIDAGYQTQAVIEELASVVESEEADEANKAGETLESFIHNYVTTSMGYKKTGLVYNKANAEHLETVLTITSDTIHGLSDLVVIEVMTGKNLMSTDEEILSSIKAVVRYNE